MPLLLAQLLFSLPTAADSLDDEETADTPATAASVAAAAPVTAAAPTPACEQQSALVPIASETGSAGIMYNLAEHPESIRAVAGRLLNEALTEQKKPGIAAACGECKSSGKARIVYTVGPMHFLPESEQEAVCKKLDAETRKKPFLFPPRHFPSIPKMNDWVMAFSQGRGEEGKSLYERCSSNCSPRYQFVISPDTDGLAVAAQVQCGLARDRSSEDYEVSTALQLDCADGKAAHGPAKP